MFIGFARRQRAIRNDDAECENWKWPRCRWKKQENSEIDSL
jgi:hypothetical protein